jgi:hypothetical protein
MYSTVLITRPTEQQGITTEYSLNASIGSFIKAGGVERLSISNCDMRRTAVGSNEVLTNLVDDLFISDSRFNMLPSANTANTILLIDTLRVYIANTFIGSTAATYTANAAIQWWRVNLSKTGGDLYIDNCIMDGQTYGVEGPSVVHTLDNFKYDADTSTVITADVIRILATRYVNGGVTEGSPVTFTSTDATPSVQGNNLFKTAGTTAITDFDDGLTGQTIQILATNSIRITYNSSIIILKGSTHYDMTVGDTLTLTMFNEGVWSEVARSVN